MSHVLVIGCGNIGFRHLQAVCGVVSVETVSVVESDPSRLDEIERAGTLPATQAEVRLHGDVESVLKEGIELDLVISAVTADQQPGLLPALRELKPAHILLEKPVAQSRASFDRIRGQLSERNAHVNCIRSSFAGYRRLHERLASSDSRIHLEVRGRTGGVGCNGVHFLDLFRFLTRETVLEVESADLRPVSNKRGARFEEFSGRLNVRTPRGDTMTLSASVDPDAGPLTITVAPGREERPYLTCNEELDTAVDLRANQTRELGVRLVSQATALHLEWIEGREDSPVLPSLAATAPAHLALYDALSAATGRTEFNVT